MTLVTTIKSRQVSTTDSYNWYNIQQHTTAFNTLYYQLRPALIIIKLRDRVIFQLHVHEHVLDDDDDDDGGPYSEEYLSGIV